MVRPLRRHEHAAWRAENPGLPGFRVLLAIDRENQPGRDARERVVIYEARSANRIARDRALLAAYGKAGTS